MRITSKGQVTIPQQIRDQAGLLPGSEVEFSIERGKVVLKPVASTTKLNWAEEALNNLRGSGNNPMFKGWTTDQIMAFLRGED